VVEATLSALMQPQKLHTVISITCYLLGVNQSLPHTQEMGSGAPALDEKNIKGFVDIL
jgi:hypothetical protein